MHVLFIHQTFPAQFGRLGLELSRRYGWQCSFLIGKEGNCPEPTPAMRALSIYRLNLPVREEQIQPWTQIYERSLELGLAVYQAVTAHPELRPDLVVAHTLLGPTLFLADHLRCPTVHYCEYYYAPGRRDLTYRVDLRPAPMAPFYMRCTNAPLLLELIGSAGGYAPTEWQKRTFPRRFWPKIEVHFDGVDTELYRPQTVARDQAERLLAGRSLPSGTRVVTYVARGLESIRGFDLFMQVARRIAQQRADVLFVVVGSDQSCYGWDRLHTGSWNFKEWVFQQDDYDRSRFVFLGAIDSERLAQVLALSDLHVYLTVPFTVSWSLFNALASGCVVLASDVPPVCEVMRANGNGLLEPLFDLDRLTAAALRVLDDPAAFAPLRQAARHDMETKYSLDVAVPELKDYFERRASTVR